MYTALEDWVTGYFLPMFRRTLGGEFRWCAQWWQHGEAISRLTCGLGAAVDAYIAWFAGERDETGRRLVVRDGRHQPRQILTSAGIVEVTVLRVNDRRTDLGTGERASGWQPYRGCQASRGGGRLGRPACVS